MNTKDYLLQFVLSFFDPLWFIDEKVKKRLHQAESSLLKKVALLQFSSWSLLYFSFYYINDRLKPNLIVWRNYRFSVAAIIAILGATSYVFREKPAILKLNLYLLAAILCVAMAWSMTLGQPIRIKWLVIFPITVLMMTGRSFIFPTSFLILIIVLTKGFWIGHAPLTWMITETEMGVFVLLLAFIVRRIWIETKVNTFIHDDLVTDNIKQKEIFYRQITSFISPVLIKKIESDTQKNENLIYSVDSILRRTRKQVSVLYSDLRNFSSRSDDMDFIEKELIPSAISIIDSAELNLGIAKQVGDAVLVFYSLEDPEETLLRAMKDGLRCCTEEARRIHALGRKTPERFFTITFGEAFVGNMASAKHREATIIGKPANLASRIDTLTKEEALRNIIMKNVSLILDSRSAAIIGTFANWENIDELKLDSFGIKIRSYPDEKSIFLMHATEKNIFTLNELLKINNIPVLESRERDNG